MLNQLVRYAPLIPVLKRELGTIVEVGSGQTGISQYLGRRVTGVEIRFPGPPGPLLVPVIGTATALPFADRSFDVVLVMDTMEHIPQRFRGTAIDEAMRITKRMVVFGGPMGAAARDADKRLAAYYEKRGVGVPDWLAQHLSEGAPDVEDIAQPLRSAGFDVSVRGNENLRGHLALMRLETHRYVYRGFAELRTRVPGVVAAAARTAHVGPYYSYLITARR